MKGSLLMKIRAFHRYGRIRMKMRESEKETLGVLPASKYLFLEDLSISELILTDSTLLKNSFNKLIFRAMDLGISKEKIEILVAAGDVIDNIIDDLKYLMDSDKRGLREAREQL